MKYNVNLLFTERKLEFGEKGRRYRIKMEITKGVPRIQFIETPQHESHEYESYMTETLGNSDRTITTNLESIIPKGRRSLNKTKTKINTPTFVMVVLYDHKGLKMSQRIDWDKPMYNMWQTPGGKVEEGETSKQAALRELEEETGIKATEWNLQFILNNPKYNTDIYICRMMDYWILRNPESHKQTI